MQETSYETHPQSLKAVSWLFYLHAQVIDLKVLGSNEGKVVSSWDYDYIICYKGGICCLSLLTQSFDCATENALKKVKKYLELHHRKQNVTGEVFNGIWIGEHADKMFSKGIDDTKFDQICYGGKP